MRINEIFEEQAMEYLTEDTYCLCDKIDALYDALGYLLLDESELPDDLVAETKLMCEHLKKFKNEYVEAQLQA